MKRIQRCFLLFIVLLLGMQLPAQEIVDGFYKGKKVWMKYYKGASPVIKELKYDNEDVSDLQKKVGELQKKLESCSGTKPVNSPQGGDSKSQVDVLKDSLKRLQLILWQKDYQASQQVEEYEKSLDDKTHQVDSLSNLLAGYRSKADDIFCMHIGVQYRVGLPQLLNPLLMQLDGQGDKIWTRNLTLAHHVGLFYGTASLTKNFPLSIGVGVEYERLQFKAGIGYLYNTIQQAIDAEQDSYTAYITYNNVLEDVTLHYVNIPISLSLGQPCMNRMSGYGQFTLTPSVCIAQSFSSSGTYSHAGHYSQLSGTDVDLYLDDMPSLGFGNGFKMSDVQKAVSVNRFVLLGRLSAGFYLPLCNMKKGKSSPCVFKMGVSVDFTFTPIAKDMGADAAMPEAQYRLQQYNLLNGQGCRYVSPALEVGLLYLIKKH